MTEPRPETVTEILQAVGAGNERAEQKLIPLVYDELKKIAHHKMAREYPGHALQTTALVHESYLRLVQDENVRWQNRAHFMAAAAEAMRRILVERARSIRALKHGGDRSRVSLDTVKLPIEQPSVDVEALSESLEELQRKDPRACQVVRLRYFVGLSIDETAEVLGIAPRTVRADWTVSKAWLRPRLAGRERSDEGGLAQ